MGEKPKPFAKMPLAFLTSPAFADMPPRVLKALLCLWHWRNYKTGECYPRRGVLATRLGLTQAQTSDVIRATDTWLRKRLGPDFQFVTRERDPQGMFRRNVYHVPAWDKLTAATHVKKSRHGCIAQEHQVGKSQVGKSQVGKPRHPSELEEDGKQSESPKVEEGGSKNGPRPRLLSENAQKQNQQTTEQELRDWAEQTDAQAETEGWREHQPLAGQHPTKLIHTWLALEAEIAIAQTNPKAPVLNSHAVATMLLAGEVALGDLKEALEAAQQQAGLLRNTDNPAGVLVKRARELAAARDAS